MRQAAHLQQIILYCLAESRWPQPPPVLRALLAAGDFAGLPEAAEDHGVAGYVFHRLRELPGMHASTLEALKTRSLHALSTHLRAVGDVALLRQILDAAPHPWLVVNGPVLVECVYRQPELRAYQEIDVVVPRRALAHIVAVLERAGCAAVDDGPVSGGASPAADLLLWYGSRAKVHWNVVGGVPTGRSVSRADTIFARSRPVTLNGIPVATAGEVDSLIHLVMCASRDKTRLGWLKDIERVIQAGRLDWDELMACAADWGVLERLKAELRRAQQLIGAPVPADVLRSGRVRLASGVVEQLLQTARSVTGNRPSEWSAVAAAVPSRGRRSRRAEVALLQLIRPDTESVVRLPLPLWWRLLSTADREGIAALTYQAIHRLGDEGTPQEVVRVLSQRYQEAAVHVARAYTQLGELLRALRVAGVVPLLLKGAALAQFTYPDRALRPFRDLDLLVPPDEVALVHRVLRDEGYKLAGGSPTEADIAWRHGRGYFDPDGRRLPVDVHWRYAGYPHLFPLDYASVFSLAGEHRIEGESVRTPGPADMLVALSVSFIREIWYRKPRLRYLRDVAEVVRRGPVDWDRVLEVTAQSRLLRSPVDLTLNAAHELLGTAIPDRVLRSLRPRRSAGVARYLHRRICANILIQEHVVDGLLQIALMRWLDDPSISAILHWAKSLVFVPRPLAASRRRWLLGLLARK